MAKNLTKTASTVRVEANGEHVPGRSHYSADYLRDERAFSLASQLDAVLSLNPAHVLEVGLGTGIVATMLKASGIAVTTLDVQAELQPDLIGSVTSIPSAEGQFDVGLCCQVLEHLPFDQFEIALLELHRVLRRALVLSLPDISRWIGFFVSRPPRGAPRSYGLTLPALRVPEMPKDRLTVAGHHWEIGYRGSPLRRVTSRIAAAGWSIDREWRVPQKPWHHFFMLVKA